MKTFTYETTYESTDSNGTVTGEEELRFTYTYRPATELEIVQIEEKSHGIASMRGEAIQVTRWIPVEDDGTRGPVQRDRYDFFREWAEQHYDAMVEHASQPEDEG